MPILPTDEISTIFLVGFPADFRERELYNLFMFATGFEGVSLKCPDQMSVSNVSSGSASPSHSTIGSPTLMGSSGEGNDSASISEDDSWIGLGSSRSSGTVKQQIIGFARFHRRQDALAARDHLNGRCIDPDRGTVLKVEMAKKNLFIAPRKQSIHAAFGDLAALASPPPSIDLGDFGDFSPPIHKTTRSLSLSIPGNPEPIDICIPPTTVPMKSNISPSGFASPPLSEAKASTNSRSYSLNGSQQIYVLGENPPCNTLYVGNLPLNADEDELRTLFCRCPGYKRLSFKVKANGPMCFVEFDDVACATSAMDSLYGTLLSTSTKGGIRLSYSKNPLGVRPSTTQPPTAIGSATSFMPSSMPPLRCCQSHLEEDDSSFLPRPVSFPVFPGHLPLDGIKTQDGPITSFRSLTMTPFSPF